MLTIGIDAHHRLYAMCILDEAGAVVKEHTIRGGPAEVAAWLGALGKPMRVCYEASLGYGLLHDRLLAVGARVKVAHPARLRAIWQSKRKSDRIDARALATILHLDRVPEVHVPSLDVRQWRGLIEHRTRLVDKRTRAKNSLRAIFREHGVVAPGGSALWSRKGLTWAAAAELPSPLARLRRDQLLDEIARLTQWIKGAEAELAPLAEGHPGVQLLMTIPGVGPRTAEAVVAYVDDASRFGSTRRVGSYFGLVPSLDESAGTKRYGHITRQGPGTVRRLLVEAAWRARRLSPTVRAFFDRVRDGKKDRTAKAVVATGHYLVRVMVAMLKSGQPWRERVIHEGAGPVHQPEEGHGCADALPAARSAGF